MSAPAQSLLDSTAISGCYLFPQARRLSDPSVVEVTGAELACYRKVVDPDALTLVHFHGNGEAIADYVPDMVDELTKLGLNSLFVKYREYGGSTGKRIYKWTGGSQKRLLRFRQGNHNTIRAFNHEEYLKDVAFLARAAGGDC